MRSDFSSNTKTSFHITLHRSPELLDQKYCMSEFVLVSLHGDDVSGQYNGGLLPDIILVGLPSFCPSTTNVPSSSQHSNLCA